MDNISTNFPGFSNLPSSVALHNLGLGSESFTTVDADPAADINFIGSLEGGIIITGVSISDNTPALANDNWNLVARNADPDVADVIVGTFTQADDAFTGDVGMYTKLSADASDNIRLLLTPVDAGDTYVGAVEFDLTLYITYTNAH